MTVCVRLSGSQKQAVKTNAFSCLWRATVPKSCCFPAAKNLWPQEAGLGHSHGPLLLEPRSSESDLSVSWATNCDKCQHSCSSRTCLSWAPPSAPGPFGFLLELIILSLVLGFTISCRFTVTFVLFIHISFKRIMQFHFLPT